MDSKPFWMQEHEASDNQQFTMLHDELKEVRELLTPISETYTTVRRMGKWSMAFLVLISIVLGIVLSLKSVFGK